MINGVAGHLRTHLHDLLQTHKLYLILWKDRLSNSAALLGKASSIAIVSVDSNIMQALILRLRCARLKDLTGLWFHNFLRSILKVLRLLKNIFQFSTCWTSFDVLAFHNFGQNFFTAKALEILRQMLSQYRTFIQAYYAFNHMNQSICTSWCFIKSTQMLVYEAGWRPILVHQS